MEFFISSTSGQSKQNDSIVTTQISLPTPVVTGASPERTNSKEANGHSREANHDVNDLTTQSPEQPKQLMSSAKPGDPLVVILDQSPDRSSEPTISPHQQGSGPLNVQASCQSKVSSDSTHSEAQQKSSGDILSVGTYWFVC